MPVFNGAAHLELTVRSLLRQSLADFELIAVDDGSTDESWAILETFAERDARVQAPSPCPQPGHAVASNTAIERSRGQFIARLDQDDLFLSDRLRSPSRSWRRGPRSAWCIRSTSDGCLMGAFPTKAAARRTTTCAAP